MTGFAGSPSAGPTPSDARTAGRIEASDLTASYGSAVAFAGVNLVVDPAKVTAIIGPSGCGKSTLLRCMNGLHLSVPGASVSGGLRLDGVPVYDRTVDLADLRRNVGMVFQRPNPFPAMSIAGNVAAGLTLGRRMRRSDEGLAAVIEQSLRRTGLWDEVKDRLDRSGASLSGGQQQRLCIARCLAVGPQVLLMDEPCSALDPASTLAIERLIEELKAEYTVVIVTHNMEQAARVSDVTAFMTVGGAGQPGELVEVARTDDLFSHPAQQATQDYIAGRVG